MTSVANVMCEASVALGVDLQGEVDCELEIYRLLYCVARARFGGEGAARRQDDVLAALQDDLHQALDVVADLNEQKGVRVLIGTRVPHDGTLKIDVAVA